MSYIFKKEGTCHCTNCGKDMEALQGVVFDRTNNKHGSEYLCVYLCDECMDELDHKLQERGK